MGGRDLKVQKTISQHMEGGQIEEIKKETRTTAGKSMTVYETIVRKPGPSGKKSKLKWMKTASLLSWRMSSTWLHNPLLAHDAIGDLAAGSFVFGSY